MNRIASFVAALCLMAGAAFAADTAAIEQKLVDTEAALSKALVAKDIAWLENTFADDWVGQYADGRRTKAAYLADIKSGANSSSSMTNHDVRARVMGNFAFVQGMDDETSNYKGKDTSGTYSWTDIYENRGGKWVCIASQVTKMEK